MMDLIPGLGPTFQYFMSAPTNKTPSGLPEHTLEKIDDFACGLPIKNIQTCGKIADVMCIFANKFQKQHHDKTILTLLGSDGLIKDLEKFKNAMFEVNKIEAGDEVGGMNTWMEAMRTAGIEHPYERRDLNEYIRSKLPGKQEAIQFAVTHPFETSLMAQGAIAAFNGLSRESIQYLLSEVDYEAKVTSKVLSLEEKAFAKLIQFRKAVTNLLANWYPPQGEVPQTPLTDGQIRVTQIGSTWVVTEVTPGAVGDDPSYPRARIGMKKSSVLVPEENIVETSRYVDSFEKFLKDLIIKLSPTNLVKVMMDQKTAELNKTRFGRFIMFLARIIWTIAYPVRIGANRYYQYLIQDLPTLDEFAGKVAHNLVTLIESRYVFKTLILREIDRVEENLKGDAPAAAAASPATPALPSDETLGHLFLACGNIVVATLIPDIEKFQNCGMTRLVKSIIHLAVRSLDWSIARWWAATFIKRPIFNAVQQRKGLEIAQEVSQIVDSALHIVHTAPTPLEVARQIATRIRLSTPFRHAMPHDSRLYTPKRNWAHLIHDTFLDLGSEYIYRKQFPNDDQLAISVLEKQVNRLARKIDLEERLQEANESAYEDYLKRITIEKATETLLNYKFSLIDPAPPPVTPEKRVWSKLISGISTVVSAVKRASHVVTSTVFSAIDSRSQPNRDEPQPLKPWQIREEGLRNKISAKLEEWEKIKSQLKPGDLDDHKYNLSKQMAATLEELHTHVTVNDQKTKMIHSSEKAIETIRQLTPMHSEQATLLDTYKLFHPGSWIDKKGAWLQVVVQHLDQLYPLIENLITPPTQPTPQTLPKASPWLGAKVQSIFSGFEVDEMKGDRAAAAAAAVDSDDDINAAGAQSDDEMKCNPRQEAAAAGPEAPAENKLDQHEPALGSPQPRRRLRLGVNPVSPRRNPLPLTTAFDHDD